MTTAARRGDADRSPRWRALDRLRRVAAEEVVLALLALSILIVPAATGGAGDGAVKRTTFPAAPLTIEVNRAPWYEWVLLPGIGEVRARRIVEYRDAHGPFRGPADLERIPGLPAGWVDRARPHLEFEVEGPRKSRAR